MSLELINTQVSLTVKYNEQYLTIKRRFDEIDDFKKELEERKDDKAFYKQLRAENKLSHNNLVTRENGKFNIKAGVVTNIDSCLIDNGKLLVPFGIVSKGINLLDNNVDKITSLENFPEEVIPYLNNDLKYSCGRIGRIGSTKIDEKEIEDYLYKACKVPYYKFLYKKIIDNKVDIEDYSEHLSSISEILDGEDKNIFKSKIGIQKFDL